MNKLIALGVLALSAGIWWLVPGEPSGHQVSLVQPEFTLALPSTMAPTQVSKSPMPVIDTQTPVTLLPTLAEQMQTIEVTRLNRQDKNLLLNSLSEPQLIELFTSLMPMLDQYSSEMRKAFGEQRSTDLLFDLQQVTDDGISWQLSDELRAELVEYYGASLSSLEVYCNNNECDAYGLGQYSEVVAQNYCRENSNRRRIFGCKESKFVFIEEPKGNRDYDICVKRSLGSYPSSIFSCHQPYAQPGQALIYHLSFSWPRAKDTAITQVDLPAVQIPRFNPEQMSLTLEQTLEEIVAMEKEYNPEFDNAISPVFCDDFSCEFTVQSAEEIGLNNAGELTSMKSGINQVYIPGCSSSNFSEQIAAIEAAAKQDTSLRNQTHMIDITYFCRPER